MAPSENEFDTSALDPKEFAEAVSGVAEPFSIFQMPDRNHASSDNKTAEADRMSVLCFLNDFY